MEIYLKPEVEIDMDGLVVKKCKYILSISNILHNMPDTYMPSNK